MDELKNILAQPNRYLWRDQPPKVLRGDIREAFQLGANADKMECQCWNASCPYHGDCRKCIVFHMALKQFPTCQRSMVQELYLADLLETDLYIKRDAAPAEEPKAE